MKQKCSKALFEQWNFILKNIDLEFRLSAAIVLTNTLIAEYANFQDGYTILASNNKYFSLYYVIRMDNSLINWNGLHSKEKVT